MALRLRDLESAGGDGIDAGSAEDDLALVVDSRHEEEQVGDHAHVEVAGEGIEEGIVVEVGDVFLFDGGDDEEEVGAHGMEAVDLHDDCHPREKVILSPILTTS